MEDGMPLDGVAEVRLQMLWLIKRQETRLLMSISHRIQRILKIPVFTLL
jgi:hypothetical protein